MGSLIPPELTLDCSLSPITWAAKATGGFLAEVSRIHTSPKKISMLDDCVNRLQDEMKKIDAFKRELPLCMLLLNDAIAAMKEELVQCKNSAAKPIMEEFIPLKKSIAGEDDEKIEDVNEEEIVCSRDKMNWMSSVQLWNSDDQNYDEPSTSKLDNDKKRKEEAISKPEMGDLFPSGKTGAERRAFDFEPFKGCANFPATKMGKEGKDEPPLAAALSLATPEMKYSKEEIYSSGFSSKSSSTRSGSSSESNFKAQQQQQQQQAGRKQRRCWSPELHRRFINALEHLGGPQAATPKQIRELMQVDGLTNDEVKSHLQKYRLHTRRAAPTTAKTSTVETVVLGNLYMSREQCNESSKKSNSNSGSPPGPLHLAGSSRANSMTTEGEEDEKSESHSWIKSTHNHLSGRV